ncbi:hypothetical protein I302_103960 [Kwoniella bestiolae CBS 10118]|uniref:Uncharacterized protein n=1 Tax=Kwoniella bestiolae CBS 10118 TaxID=1296100 RepID=A0A1B9G9X9_9TREE|nr:hypothetical protein I302_02666 [Kwoniella bestiolae CBS 10118]OCF27817.1 hypothetical protein I302_02666 [Kwoniella bestiolae CBS 10118]
MLDAASRATASDRLDRDSPREETGVSELGTTEPLHLDMDQTSLIAFRDLANVSDPHCPSLSFQQAKLLQQCDKFICNDNITSAVRRELYEWGRTRPCELLVLASDGNDTIMGRVALENMTDSTSIEQQISGDLYQIRPLQTKRIWGRMRMLSPAWQIELIWLAFDGPRGRQVIMDQRSYGGRTEKRTIVRLNADWGTLWQRSRPTWDLLETTNYEKQGGRSRIEKVALKV